MFEAEINGGELKSNEEGTASLYLLKDFPPISPHRIGSQKAMEAYWRKLAGDRA
jgi:hypothetical protein